MPLLVCMAFECAPPGAVDVAVAAVAVLAAFGSVRLGRFFIAISGR